MTQSDAFDTMKNIFGLSLNEYKELSDEAEYSARVATENLTIADICEFNIPDSNNKIDLAYSVEFDFPEDRDENTYNKLFVHHIWMALPADKINYDEVKAVYGIAKADTYDGQEYFDTDASTYSQEKSRVVVEISDELLGNDNIDFGDIFQNCKNTDEFQANVSRVVSKSITQILNTHISLFDIANKETVSEHYGYPKGYTFIYDSHGADSELNKRTGTVAEIIRPLTADEADLSEVGPMYKVKFQEDGFETDVFIDEICKHISYGHMQSKMNDFDEEYAEACSFVRHKLVDHFFNTDNWTNEHIESITGEVISDTFLEEFDSEYLDDLLMTNSDFDLQTMIKYAEEFNVDLTELMVPYKVIVYSHLPFTKEDELLNTSDDDLKCFDVLRYEVCTCIEDLISTWKELYKEHEGCWYAVKDGEGVIVGGAMDINDLDIIESLPTFIAEWTISNKVTGYLRLDNLYPDVIDKLGSGLSDSKYQNTYDEAMNEMWENADLGDCRNADQTDHMEFGVIEVTGEQECTVYAYTASGARSRAIEAFSEANFEDLADIQLDESNIVSACAYNYPSRFHREAVKMLSSVEHGYYNSIAGVVSGQAILISLRADESLEDVYELTVAKKDSSEIIGKIYDICDAETLATALENIEHGTAVLTCAKGKKIDIGTSLNKRNIATAKERE